MPTSDPAHLTRSGNLKSILAILAASVFFTIVDVMMKLSSESLPVGETIVIRNSVSSLLILGYGFAVGGMTLPRNPPWGHLSWRMVGEGGSTLAFLSALSMMPIADAAGVAQFGPLALTAAAAVFLGERVGWRRWTAAFIGLVGVLIILRPGSSAASAGGLLVLLMIALNIVRDFATRAISIAVPTLTLTAMSSVATLASGFLLWPFETWTMPGTLDLVRLAVAGLALIGGYVCMIVTMRVGEVSAAAPFRYSAMVWALLAGWVVWSDVPDGLSLLGMLTVCLAGLYTLEREMITRKRPHG